MVNVCALLTKSLMHEPILHPFSGNADTNDPTTCDFYRWVTVPSWRWTPRMMFTKVYQDYKPLAFRYQCN